MKINVEPVGDGFAIDFTCDFCGVSATVTHNPDFGLDCPDRCAEKAYLSDPDAKRYDELMLQLVEQFLPKVE